MNKQEALKRIEVQKKFLINLTGWAVYVYIVELIKSLDEPEKVKVPQFVAEHIKHAKEIGRDLQDAMNSSSIHAEVDEWLYTDNNMELFARAWLDGYEVEKEKRYLVKVVGMDSVNGYLSYNKDLDRWFFGIASKSKPYRSHHTRKQLEEADFGWVFDCEGIEIEEMEHEN